MSTVLLVADAGWVRNEVRAGLSEPDTTLVEEGDPRRAVAAAGEACAHVVLVDMQVGSMGGMAIVRAIRDAAGLGELPPTATVILLDRSADAFLADRAGADAWLAKPFTAHQLRAVIRRALDRHPVDERS